ncbi:MAG TPA: hypothetical protein VFV19_10415 [Candidatus Polarisedimenticolaceae bacterium]|nr:hypothetical protein [Candidatus Polarisedimenticolaceae bacterium]
MAGPPLYASMVLLWALMMAPPVFYLTRVWPRRRREVLALLSNEAIALYFETYYPAEVPDVRDGRERIARFFDEQFSRRRYYLPLLLLAAMSAFVVYWSMSNLSESLRHDVAPSEKIMLAVLALAGAYMWVVSELITRWRAHDMAPSDLIGACLRLAIGLPMGYALSALSIQEIRGPLAFMLGAFPTKTLMGIARRVSSKKLDLGEDGPFVESELEKLQGINTRAAEKLADEGVTTIVQLAYGDPLDLMHRCSSFSFSYIVDCMSQALAWIYFPKDLPNLTRYSMRGAMEIGTLIDDLDGGNAAASAAARATLTAGAKCIALDEAVLERTLREIAGDPYTLFIRAVWQQNGS